VSSLALQGRVVTETEVWENGTVVIEGSKILAVLPQRVDADETRRIQESYLVPGFVDLQLNGAFGIDIATDPRRLPQISTSLPKTGTTSYLPTLVTLPLGRYPGVLSGIPLDTGSGAEPLGLHLEGPFINPLKRGAHPVESVAVPDPETLQRLLDLATIKMVTAAPELSGFPSLARVAGEREVLVSLGHSDASFEEALAALDSGACASAHSVTHLFNAMSPLHHREPGLPGAALAHGEVSCGIIADGRHVHPEMVRLAFERLGPDRMYLVTDAIAAAGMEIGEYTLAGHRVFMEDGVPRLEDRTLAGSVLTMDAAFRNVISFTGCALAEAVRMAATTPASLIGEGARKGRLAPGFDADVAALSSDLEVKTVWVGGREAFDREGVVSRAGEHTG
jgi:N-acetylglucosamine-6-phosphate deacetylase